VELIRAGVREIGAAEYPDPDGPEYLAQHDAWGMRVRSLLEGAVLREVHPATDGGATFIFHSGVVLAVISAEGHLDETRWYGHWYAKGDEWPRP